MKLLLLYILLNYIIYTDADLFCTTFLNGPFTVHFVYNNNTISTDHVALVKYDSATQEVWFQTVAATSTTQNIACRRLSQERIIWGPNGCSDTLNPTQALQSSNCITNQVDVENIRTIFYQTWYLSKISNECYLNGGDGNIRLCMGPMRLAQDNEDSFIPHPPSWPTNKELLSAQIVFIDTLTGPSAMSPAVVEVPLVRPKLNVTIIDGSCGGYSQLYNAYSLDPQDRQTTSVWRSFKAVTTPTLRVLLKRDGGIDSVNFHIVLATSVGAAGEYTYEYKSATQVTTTGGVLLFSNWVELINFGTVYQFYDYDTGDMACNITLEIVAATTQYELEEIEILTPATYPLNKNPRRFWRTRVCNVQFGRLDSNGNLFYPNCPMGDVCGGYCTYAYPGYPGLPIRVPANPYLSYRLTGEEFYPKNDSFLNYGQDGVTGRVWTSRINIQQQRVFSAFLVPDLITLNTNPNEKFTQCQKLGGYTWGTTSTHCAMDITQTYCQKGYYYFNQRCYYKFDPTTEAKYAVPIGQSDDACSLLNTYTQPLVETDIYLEAWLLGWYLYENRDINNFALYRIPQYQSDRCTCFNTYTFTKQSDCSCYDIQETTTNFYIFPICSYPITVSELEPFYMDVAVSLETATLWQNGQEGPLTSGFEAICNCYDGWTGKNCDRWTCPLSRVITEDPANLNVLVTFFDKCYKLKHGSCYNDQSRVCQCNYGYGPPASILPELIYLYLNRDFPCACPAAASPESLYYQVNEGFYDINEQTGKPPCSGVDQGYCIVDNSTNAGTCQSVKRLNILLNIEEDAFDGKATSCEKPIQPWRGDTKNGLIVSALCNYKGQCCPFGQNLFNPLIGDLYSSACWDADGEEIVGCACDNGWGGESCTCPVPTNYARNRFKEQTIIGDQIYTIIDMGSKYFISHIKFTNCTLPTLVQISNGIAQPDASSTCVFNSTIQYFVCSSIVAYRYIVFQGDSVLECRVDANEQYYQYCGYNHTVNPFAGRFYAIPAYRSATKNLLQQYVGVATFGCTNTDCMCGPNWGGKLCAAGVSSIRETEVEIDGVLETVQAKRYCGETVLVPNLNNPVLGRGVISPIYNNCTCSSISSVDNTGRIGRTVERFIGDSCQCATAYNFNYNEVMTCAGHGDCVQSDFPYGMCEADLDKYAGDALFTPYVEVTDFGSDVVEMVVTEDIYVYAYVDITTLAPTNAPTRNPTPPTPPTSKPTRNPTKFPTLTPTDNPTRNPTRKPTQNPTTAKPTTNPTESPTETGATTSPTKNPSQNPTRNPTRKPTNNPTRNPTKNPTLKPTVKPSANPTANPTPKPIILFAEGTLTPSATVAANAPTGCPAKASSLGLTCSNVIPFFSTESVAISSFPGTYGFPTSANVVGPPGVTVGIWSTIFSGTPSPTGPTVLTNDLQTAGVMPPVPAPVSPTAEAFFWSGTNPDASITPGVTCTSWTGSTGDGTVGLRVQTNGRWIGPGFLSCSLTPLRYLCLCV